MFISTTGGFPSRFLEIKSMIDNHRDNYEVMRAIFTLITFTRAIIPSSEEEAKLSPKFDSIIKPYTGKNYTIPQSFIRSFISLNGGIKEYKVDIQKDAYFSTKSSPFGTAVLSTWYSILGIGYGLFQSLLYLNNNDQRLVDIYKFSFENYEYLKQKNLVKVSHPGKLAIVNDPELKKRVIAMIDYYSQLHLKPIHDILLKILSKMPCDRTFTQSPNFSVKIDSNHKL